MTDAALPTFCCYSADASHQSWEKRECLLVLRQHSSVFVSVDQHINATSQCQQIEAHHTKLLEAIKEPVKVTLGNFKPICSDKFQKKEKNLAGVRSGV